MFLSLHLCTNPKNHRMQTDIQFKEHPGAGIKVQRDIKTAVTISYGDGIGPEIMEATLGILKAAGAKLDIEEIEVGERVYNSGVSTGISEQAWDSIRKNKVFLKGVFYYIIPVLLSQIKADRRNRMAAGRLFLRGSRTLICIQTAPIIRNPIAAEAGMARNGYQMETNRTSAASTFRVPTMNIIALESPYTSNSSCMLSASPPRH